ncbi:MAG: ABC transporter ATP-binding protein [Oscillospiraceae bacterium]|nr:ABC transporter ATP-binding protein [Oscillospiraceae bacterium]MBQ4642653.1 ABC transporter ATP-binding protein [Oscillospiraceae bacterium]
MISEKKQSRKKALLRILREAKPIWGWLLLSCVLCLLSIICTVVSPKMLGELVQKLYDFWSGELVTDNFAGMILAGVIPLGIIYLLLSLVKLANMYLLNNVVSRYFTCNIRIRISEKIKHLPVKFVDCTPVGEILRRMTDDVSHMGTSIHTMIETLSTGFLQIIVITVMMFFEDWRLSLAVLVITPISVYLSSKISAMSEKHFHEMFTQSGNLNAVVEESYTNYATTKAYNWENETLRRHEEINLRQRDAEVKATFISSAVRPCIAFTNSLAYIAVNLLGGWLILNEGVSVGTIVTIVLFAKQIAAPLEQIAEGLGDVQRAITSSERVFALLDLDEEKPDEKTFGDKKILGNVKFENVDFSYDEAKPLIKNLNLDIKHGQNVAIVGPTGAGKTTIVNLLMRFYDPQSGKITIDGHDIGEISREEVRGLFGMVLQDTWLFGGTVAENVAYGKPDATRDEIITACDEAYCDHFIRTLPQGYDTVIGDDTTNISGGQKQLLTIARALLANHRLLILDEATSNVDTRTEILIQKAMDKLMKDKTCFVIAHRLSTIVDSDLILVINNGEIVETGKHEELLEKKGFYYEIYNSQYAV